MDTIELQYPFEYKGERFTELTVRRPKMRDLKKAQGIKDELEKSMRMMADLTEVDPKVIDELDPVDFATLSDKVGEYMGVSAEQTPGR